MSRSIHTTRQTHLNERKYQFRDEETKESRLKINQRSLDVVVKVKVPEKTPGTLDLFVLFTYGGPFYIRDEIDIAVVNFISRLVFRLLWL
jgi:hypothetical protein